MIPTAGYSQYQKYNLWYWEIY